jgi:hypothetical protein
MQQVSDGCWSKGRLGCIKGGRCEVGWPHKGAAELLGEAVIAITLSGLIEEANAAGAPSEGWLNPAQECVCARHVDGSVTRSIQQLLSPRALRLLRYYRPSLYSAEFHHAAPAGTAALTV